MELGVEIISLILQTNHENFGSPVSNIYVLIRVNNVSLAVEREESSGILGPNGAGKKPNEL